MAGTHEDTGLDGADGVDGVDPEQEPEKLPNTGYGPFAYLSTRNSALYRRIMRVLMAEKERFAVHVRPDQVHERLALDGGELPEESFVTECLERLSGSHWGNLLAFPDSSRVTALEDFYRRRMLYQLSREGEAAERALAQYDTALGSRGALQSVALEDIVVLLASLHQALEERDREGADPQRIHQALRSLRERFVDLAENAVVFMGSIQRTIDLHDADVDAFLAYKEQLIEYLERFINDLVTRGAIIAQSLERISDEGVQCLAEVAAGREAIDAAPGEADTVLAEAKERWLRQWSGLRHWFIGAPDRDSEAKLLRSRARSAIPALLAVIRTLHEKAGGRTDRTQDFLTLAQWFSAMPSDDDRHRLWRSAFGLTSARHLSVTAETEEAWVAADLGNTTPWAEAPPLRLSPQLRRSGSYERRGKTAGTIDRTQAKAILTEQARRESEQTAAARDRILTDGPKPLSDFGELDPQSFSLFLSLLGDGLAAMGPRADTSRVHTSDGELVITLSRGEHATTAVITTPNGKFSGPNYLVDISKTFAARPEATTPQHAARELAAVAAVASESAVSGS